MSEPNAFFCCFCVQKQHFFFTFLKEKEMGTSAKKQNKNLSFLVQKIVFLLWKKKEKNRGHTIVFKKVAKSLTGYVMLLGKKKSNLIFGCHFGFGRVFGHLAFSFFSKKEKEVSKTNKNNNKKINLCCFSLSHF